MLTSESRSTRRTACSSATSSTTDPTWTGQGIERGPQRWGDRFITLWCAPMWFPSPDASTSPPFALHVTHSNLFCNFLKGFYFLGNSRGTRMYEIDSTGRWAWEKKVRENTITEDRSTERQNVKKKNTHTQQKPISEEMKQNNWHTMNSNSKDVTSCSRKRNMTRIK